MIVPNPTIPYTTVYCPPMTYGLIISQLSVFVKTLGETESEQVCLQNNVERIGILWYTIYMNNTVRQHVRR